MLRRIAETVRAAATLEIPFRSIAPLYTEAPPIAGGIPNRVFQTWVEPRLGRSHANELAAFRRRNPAYTFEFFDSDDIDAYMQTHFEGHPILPIYTRCLHGPARTDIWRYCILFERGGWYFDINKMVTVPLDTLCLPEDDAILTFEKNDSPLPLASPAVRERLPEHKIIANWGLGFAPGHPVLRRAIDSIVAAYPRYRGVTVDNLKAQIIRFTGPVCLTRAVVESFENDDASRAKVLPIDFGGAGVHRMRGSWTRYLQQPSYRHLHDVVLVT